MSTMIDELKISYDELKSLVLESFRSRPATQLASVLADVGFLAVQKSIVSSPHRGVVQGATYSLKEADESRVIEILWDLIIERVLTMGRSGVNAGWPFFNVTSYGRKLLASPPPIPHDPSGYISRLRDEIPQIDSTILVYVEESLRTYNIGALLSSTVTLGCASEKALLMLIEALKDSIGDPSKKKAFETKTQGRFIKQKYDALVIYLSSIRKILPREIADGLDVILLGVFEMIRNNRNDAGHPTGKVIAREQAYASLQVFIPYCKKLYSLIDFLKTHPA